MPSKTYEPTQQHVARLRRQGFVPSAPTLPVSIGFLVMVVQAPLLVVASLGAAERQLLTTLQSRAPMSVDHLAQLILSQLREALRLVAIGLGVATTALVVVSVAQTGGFVRASRHHVRLTMPLKSPSLFLAHLARVQLAPIVVCLLAARLLVRDAPEILALGNRTGRLVSVVGRQTRELLLVTAAVLVVLAACDYLVSLRHYLRESKMTRLDRKREEREQRGPVEILEARRLLRTQLGQVPPSTLLPYCRFIIDDGNATSLLCAYDPVSCPVPRIIATVEGPSRERILTQAGADQIPIATDLSLCNALCRHGATPPTEVLVALAKLVAELPQGSTRIRTGTSASPAP